LGRLRIYASRTAAMAVVAPIWGRFLSTYPEIHLELAVGEAPIDIVAKGFDAGIGPRNRAAADMIAVRVMGPMKIAVVGTPSYFAKHRPPRTPDDLVRHSCVQYRQEAEGDVLVWPFERNRKSRRISVDGRVMVNSSDLAVRAALDGLGIAYTIEAVAEPSCARDCWFACWKIGHHRSRDCFSTIPATGRSQRHYAPLST
jgi:DNA-binding transcriptional LysR family regulator